MCALADLLRQGSHSRESNLRDARRTANYSTFSTAARIPSVTSMCPAYMALGMSTSSFATPKRADNRLVECKWSYGQDKLSQGSACACGARPVRG